MTHSPPENPRNPIPERRKRPPAGVTFDEMIGIIVAMTTIGAILFWSLGGKKDNFASNFGLGGDNNLLSSNTDGAVGFGRGKPSSDINYRQEESNQGKSTARSRRQNSSVTQELPVAAAPPKQKADQSSEDFVSQGKGNRKSSRFGSVGKLAPFTGFATLPALKTPANENQADGAKGNLNTDTGDKTGSQATIPDKSDGGDKTDSQATAPDKIETPDDITPSYWAYPFVKQMSDQGLVPDLADDKNDDKNFEPDKLITRSGMATLISQAFDTQPETQKIKKFKDVTSKNAVASDIDKAVRTGFMQGYSDKEFRPEENIPRYQVLVTLATGLGLKPSQDAEQILQKFGDGGDMPNWAKEQVAAAAEAGLIVNPPDVTKDSIKPNQSATRGEVAAMIHQALVKNGKLKPLKSEYILQP